MKNKNGTNFIFTEIGLTMTQSRIGQNIAVYNRYRNHIDMKSPKPQQSDLATPNPA